MQPHRDNAPSIESNNLDSGKLEMAARRKLNLDRALSASFRDPAGRLFIIDGRIIRVVNSTGVRALEAFLNSSTSQRFLEQGRLVSSEILDTAIARDLFEKCATDEICYPADASIVVEHAPLPFLNFPYEWPPEMLHSAAHLTLDLAESLLEEAQGLKDGTPYNIVFRGPKPVFVDLLSFEQRDQRDPIWLAQGQFERTFLLPLLANKYFGLPLDQLLCDRRDGLEPEEVYRLCGPLRRLAPNFLSLVSIPVWLARRLNQDDNGIYQKRIIETQEKSRFILKTAFKRLRRILNNLKPDRNKKSDWSDYLETNNYDEAHFEAKRTFVEEALREFKPKRVLDVGCNTGLFSAVAARSGARVTAIDSDETVVGETWRRASAGNLDILPLMVDLSRPTPAIGWRNRECPAFLERARGVFDAVLMLALAHHLLVSERIPLSEIIDLAADLTTDVLIIEFIGPDDSMFRRLTRGRDHLFSDLTFEVFVDSCRGRFDLVRSQHFDGTSRWLFLMRKKEGRVDA